MLQPTDDSLREPASRAAARHNYTCMTRVARRESSSGRRRCLRIVIPCWACETAESACCVFLRFGTTLAVSRTLLPQTAMLLTRALLRAASRQPRHRYPSKVFCVASPSLERGAASSVGSLPPLPAFIPPWATSLFEALPTATRVSYASAQGVRSSQSSPSCEGPVIFVAALSRSECRLAHRRLSRKLQRGRACVETVKPPSPQT